MAVVTISREPGALGEEVAARFAGHLGFMLVDKARLAQLWKERDLDEAGLQCVDEDSPSDKCVSELETRAHARLVPDIIAQLAGDYDLVVIGRGAQALFRNRPGTLHVRVVAPRHFRVRQLQIHEGMSALEARRRIRDLETHRAGYLRFLYRVNWADPLLYDLTLRMDRLTVEQALNLMVTAFYEMRLHDVPKSRIVEKLLPETSERHASGHFVNTAEKEFARFLEFYGIPYEYEPRTFPLATDTAGKVTEAFTPDFYLPEQDLYIELTTMKQSLVTRKNRKVRKLRRLYPDVNIRIFYQRDFSSLLAKYDLLAMRSDGSTGLPGAGQSTAEGAPSLLSPKTGNP
jgi:cytidylate kinase